MNKILFLGSNSFTGHYFKDFINVNKLWEEFSFIGADRQDADTYPNARIEYLRINAMDETELEQILITEKPIYIINYIGTFDEAAYMDYFNVNANLTRNIFETILKYNLKVKKVLLIGSAAEYGDVYELPVKEDGMTNPVSLYGISKLMQTHISRFYFNSYGINMNVARTFNIIGKGISNKLSVGNFIEQINHVKDGGTIVTGNLKPKRDYLHINDVIEAYWEILMNGHEGEIYNVCSGKSISMEEIVTYLINGSGKILYIKRDERFAKNNDISEIYGDNSKLLKHTGWCPVKNIFSKEVISQLVWTNE
jgi:GDP-4-dehydro-6-deoxy-D-mannose reductase